MARVKSSNTTPERHVRSMAHGLGLRFRLGRKDLPGSPDIVFPKHRLAVFVHGCFWHHHEGCPRATIPKTRPDFWTKKLKGNVERDRKAVQSLNKLGWRVLVIWECELKDTKSVEARLLQITQIS